MNQVFKRAAAALCLSAAALLAAQSAHASLIADIVFVIDRSGSMGDDIAQVKARIVDFNNAMVANSIDARYGLVTFGGSVSLAQDITTYAAFTQAGSAFNVLTATAGNPEDGSLALERALTATFRANTVRNLVLITDEDDDNAANRVDLTNALAATAANELINIIGNPNDDVGNYYRDLAPANGGQFFNILDFRANPTAFFQNFIDTKVQEIIDQGTVPEPSALLLAATALLGVAGSARRRTKG